jgi:LuxR family maltose regulon positive regulatory protein
MLELLQGHQTPSFQTLMALLINGLAGTGDFFVVLDDFHTLHAPPILDMLGYLFEHLPPVMHVVLISRTDPSLALSRLRACGQLLDIRAEQLRFTSMEIAQFYDQVMGLTLSAPDVLAIETRTEGWIAGLQLAGLAMQGALLSPGSSTQAEENHHSFISAFTGSNSYIMDYLMEEVLRNQPEMTRSFLLQTAILERMCGPLCEAVVRTDTAEPLDGQAILEAIEHNRLFVIPLDTERRWFRYHQLFKEVLSRRLEVLYPGQIPDLHRRASEWFEQHAFIHEAIQHAMHARDMDRTARLVEQHGCALLMAGELVTLANWLTAIEAYTHTRPWLAMQKAWVLSLSGQLERAEVAIDAGEQLLVSRERTDEVRTLRGSFAAARAHWANTQGMTDLAAKNARHAIELLSISGDFSCSLRSIATSLLGDASWVQGRMGEARSAYAEAVQIGQIAGNPHMTMLSNASLADVTAEQGQLHRAARLYSETLQMAERVDGPNSSYAQGVHFGLSRLFYAWNRLDEAAVSSVQCVRLCKQWGNINLQAACLALTAQIHRARGGLDMAQEAVATAAAAEKWIREHTLSPYWSMWVKAELARFWINQGKIEKTLFLIHDTGVLPETFTLDTISQTGFPLDHPISYGVEPACLVLARLFLSLGNPDAALALCERMLPDAKIGERGKTVTELLILQALALHSKKEPSSALAALERAISLAWPEQATRVFLDEGERMAKLLYLAKVHHIGGEFVESMLACFGLLSCIDQPVGITPSSIQNLRVEPAALIEPLSARELEVLRAIAEGCSNQEIADRFVLSPKTVKRHISNIYAKLEAKNRTQAVALARSLKLIE